VNPVTFGWHALDLLVQWKAPRWFRILYALLGLAGNIAGQPDGITISRDRANAKVAAHLKARSCGCRRS